MQPTHGQCRGPALSLTARADCLLLSLNDLRLAAMGAGIERTDRHGAVILAMLRRQDA